MVFLNHLPFFPLLRTFACFRYCVDRLSATLSPVEKGALDSLVLPSETVEPILFKQP